MNRRCIGPVHLLILGIFTLIALLLFILPTSSGNPTPVTDLNGSPLTNDTTPIIFVSERVVHVVDGDPNYADVEAEYTLYNPLNENHNITVFLPFATHFDELQISCDDSTLPRQWDEGNSYESQIPDDIEHPEIPYFDGVTFNLSFAAHQEKTVYVNYTIFIAVTGHYFFLDESYLTYIARTGAAWNGTIGEAEFIYRIEKKFYLRGLEGFSKKTSGDYLVAKKTYQDWEPDEDIAATWYMINYQTTGVTVVYTVLLVLCCGYIFTYSRKYTGKHRLREQTLHGWKELRKKTHTAQRLLVLNIALFVFTILQGIASAFFIAMVLCLVLNLSLVATLFAFVAMRTIARELSELEPQKLER